MRLSLVLVALLAASCGARASLPAPVRPGSPVPLPEAPPARRVEPALRVDEQAALAVEIVAVCTYEGGGKREVLFFRGSAVLVAPDTALTAWHVVNCTLAPQDPKRRRVGFLDGVTGKLPGGEQRTWTVEAVVPRSDIARLHLDGAPYPLAVRQEIAPPGQEFIDDVCFEPAWPERKRSCGVIRDRFNPPPGNLRHAAPTVSGNSGAGVYDTRGQLVGIVTQQANWRVEGTDLVLPDGGCAATLWDHPWIAGPRP